MKNRLKIDFKTTGVIVLFTYLGSLALSYWVNECVKFSGIFSSSLKEYVQRDENFIYSIVWEICFFCSFIFMSLLVYCFQRRRKKQFLLTTKGLITIKKGLFWHIKNYLYTEITILIITTIITIVIYVISPYYSPLGILFRICGVSIGAVLTPFFLGMIQINNIIFSQYRWRISYYMHE